MRESIANINSTDIKVEPLNSSSALKKSVTITNATSRPVVVQKSMAKFVFPILMARKLRLRFILSFSS